MKFLKRFHLLPIKHLKPLDRRLMRILKNGKALVSVMPKTVKMAVVLKNPKNRVGFLGYLKNPKNPIMIMSMIMIMIMN